MAELHSAVNSVLLRGPFPCIPPAFRIRRFHLQRTRQTFLIEGHPLAGSMLCLGLPQAPQGGMGNHAGPGNSPRQVGGERRCGLPRNQPGGNWSA